MKRVYVIPAEQLPPDIGYLEIVSMDEEQVKCPHCGSKVLRIQYGYPCPETMDAAESGELLLGGCCISPDSPNYACPNCGQSFIKLSAIKDEPTADSIASDIWYSNANR